MGAELAYRLYQNAYNVTVIDQSDEAFHNLRPDFHGRMLQGDVLSADMASRANLEQTHALAAMTSSDALNAVVGHVARTVFHIPNVVVRNYEPRFRVLPEAFGLQHVSSSSWGAQRVEELLAPGALRTVFSAGNGEIEIYELLVDERWHGKRLQELAPVSGDCSPVALTRAGRAAMVTPDFQLQAGDILHLSATQTGIESVRRCLVSLKK